MIIHTHSSAREGSNSASGFVNSNVDNDARRTNSATALIFAKICRDCRIVVMFFISMLSLFSYENKKD